MPQWPLEKKIAVDLPEYDRRIVPPNSVRNVICQMERYRFLARISDSVRTRANSVVRMPRLCDIVSGASARYCFNYSEAIR